MGRLRYIVGVRTPKNHVEQLRFANSEHIKGEVHPRIYPPSAIVISTSVSPTPVTPAPIRSGLAPTARAHHQPQRAHVVHVRQRDQIGNSNGHCRVRDKQERHDDWHRGYDDQQANSYCAKNVLTMNARWFVFGSPSEFQNPAINLSSLFRSSE